MYKRSPAGGVALSQISSAEGTLRKTSNLTHSQKDAYIQTQPHTGMHTHWGFQQAVATYNLSPVSDSHICAESGRRWLLQGVLPHARARARSPRHRRRQSLRLSQSQDKDMTNQQKVLPPLLTPLLPLLCGMCCLTCPLPEWAVM